MIRDFAKVVVALGHAPGVSRGRMFGSEGLKVGKSVFAMEVKGKLVVKLSDERAAELRDAGLADAFDPGHGRPMRQWVAVDPHAKLDWLQISREALTFVGGLAPGLRGPEGTGPVAPLRPEPPPRPLASRGRRGGASPRGRSGP